MSRKNNLLKWQAITSGDMSQSTITSTITNIEYLDNIGAQANYTGSPVGTLSVQVSLDHAQDQNGNVTVAGSWAQITSAAIPGSTTPIIFDLNQLSAPWMRIVYTKISGTGTLDVFITGKML